MAKLDKGTLALTFKFDCDRFLRFRMASEHELDALGVNADTYKRPGIELIQAAGKRWEADKYQDLLDTSSRGSIIYNQDSYEDKFLERKPFRKVKNLFDLLRHEDPPKAIIEAEFTVPENITPGLQDAYDKFGLQEVRVRPDILWIRPGGSGAPLVGKPSNIPKYEIHVIDVKMAAEPSLRHFTEVTYYALALAATIVKEKLSERYAVSAEGLIWPGSHDLNAFRNLVQSRGSLDKDEAVTEALIETLVSVPYEVYEVHVKQFFEERLLRVLSLKPEEASWHVGPKCQLCDYVRYCKKKAEDCDHLSRLAWLTHGQAELLRSKKIITTSDLLSAIKSHDNRWQSTIGASHQLRAEEPIFLVRSEALRSGEPKPVEGRRCAMMPAWSHQNIFITIHFDPGSGITFALGALRVYFPHNRKKGEPPITVEKVFIVDRVDAMNPDTERERLKEFVAIVSEWLLEVSELNKGLQASERISSHIFFWDFLEVRQLRRMLERHMNHPDVVDLIEILSNLFPPEDTLTDPDFFKSQPGTVVKSVLKHLVGLPIPHDYTLFEVANCFYPIIREDGSKYTFDLPFGFSTPMSDQIPFERAYELWQDRIIVRHFDRRFPNTPTKWRKYSRDELYESLKKAVKMHLGALKHITSRLQENYRDRLILKKSAFSAKGASQPKVPEKARSLIAFEKLNVACQEIENRNIRALPVAEREAYFHSIRGLVPKKSLEGEEAIRKIKIEKPQYKNSILYIFDFFLTSRDARIKQGDFLLSLSNEEPALDLDEPWRKYLGLNFQDAQALLSSYELDENWMVNLSLGRLLQVTVILLEAMQEIPYIVVHPNHEKLFQLAIDEQIIDLSKPMVLDPIYQDFSSKNIEKALRTVGGKAAPVKRTKKRR